MAEFPFEDGMKETPVRYSMNTDGASPRKVMLQLAICADAWEPKVRLLGNIRAEDIKRMCDFYLYGDDKDDAISVQEREENQRLRLRP